MEMSSYPTDDVSDDRQTPQLRISARVQNKQKKDENVQIANDALASATTTENNAQADDEDEDDKDVNFPSNDDDESCFKRGKKRRRAWELWSVEDKTAFFDAINECGKDFDAIQNYLVTKSKKKGSTSSVIKNKDQVRHFYYRTWHKISKYLNINKELKKATRELYALINYGEFRRKVGGTLDEKKGQKLQELIHKGSTSLRVKGKSIRVRTPICRALKKLNEFKDDRESLGTQVPSLIQVDLVPSNMHSWNHVQSLAHNPRVRISCPMHKPITDVISYLQNKWRRPRHKIRDGMVSSGVCDEDLPASANLVLHLQPAAGVHINHLNIKLDSQVKSYALSLSSHEELLQKKEDLKKGRSRGKVSSSLAKSPSALTESGKDPEEGEVSQEETEGSDLEEEQRAYDQLIKEEQHGDEVYVKGEPTSYLSNSDDDEDEGRPTTPDDESPSSVETLHQLKALQTVANSITPDERSDVIYVGQSTGLIASLQNNTKATEDECNPEDEKQDEEAAVDIVSKQSRDSDVEKIRLGWTHSTKNASTAGELYLMFGKDLRVSLEYDFVEEMEDVFSPEDYEFKPVDMSNMMIRLLGLIRTISSSPSDNCLCSTSNTRIPNGLRSPLGGVRMSKSPNHQRSPRTPTSSKSPGDSKYSGSGKQERIKPASAKRLIPPSDAADKGTTCLNSNPEDFRAKSIGDTKILSGNCDRSVEGEFRIPVGPAPRTISQPATSSSFNSQLSKLLPRYSNPTRRTNRKNFLVQRQLPLLPKTPQPIPSFVTFKVLPQHSPIEVPVPPVDLNAPLLGLALSAKSDQTTNIITMANNALPMQIVANSFLQTTEKAISVNVSGQQLLTVEMPSASFPPNSGITSSSCSPAPLPPLPSVVEENSKDINYDSCDSLGTLLSQTLAAGSLEDTLNSSRALHTPTDFKGAFSIDDFGCPESCSHQDLDRLGSTHHPAGKTASLSSSPLNSMGGVGATSKEINLSVTCVSTSVSQTLPMVSTPVLHSFHDTTSCDKLLDISLANSNSNSSFSSLLAAVAGPTLLDSSMLQTPTRSSVNRLNFEVSQSPPSSPSRLLRQSDSQWMHTDPNDFSLSSLLGTMESPIKGGTPCLLSALNDSNPVDFTATFANLKKQTKENQD